MVLIETGYEGLDWKIICY